MRWLASLTGVGLLVIVLVSSGNDRSLLWNRHEGAQGVAVDRAFVELLLPLNRRFISLASQMQRSSGHPALRRVASRLIAVRQREDHELARLSQPIEAQVAPGPYPPVAQASADSGALALVPHDAGLGVPAHLPDRHRDKAALNRLIRLDQGAVRMGRVEFPSGAVKKEQQLSNGILRQRFDEINRLNQLYRQIWGRYSAAGGVPAPP